ncbi:carboxylesterase/lipase family protein [Aurantimonas sp. A3-2-R12]|uniref:carboxylesterase/lipase family protein n=1 Tax=Aurantimonas sp. A3-2-R12 TaxID=3114362 RepID=UPI002E17F4C1|nr:carboxylesterase family protein [Aurantimonas sp. A3-2-R12]
MPKSVLVEAPCGPVRGIEENGIAGFRGIPYAEPPVGRARFAAPKPARRFAAIFHADGYGPAAPQRRSLPEPFARLSPVTRSFSESCLNLHVWTPDITGRRPVLVFIHGGGFIIGAGAQYPGDDLARRGDIVVVTLNYRLGFFGFNAFAEIFPGDDRFAANAGLLDQRLALEWVRDNIAAFGGDPDRVTIAGESAGAASVAFHLVAHRSQPLYAQAILQSGTLNLFYTRDRAMEVSRDVLRIVSPKGDPERLFRLDHDAFAVATRSLADKHTGILSRPYLDGAELPETSLPALYGAMRPVPVLIGTNRDEFSLFSELSMFRIDSGKAALAEWVESAAGAETARRISRLYSDDRGGRIGFGTDLLFRMAAIHQADVHSSRAPTFMYRLDWEAKGLMSRLGATHSLDLPLLFEDFLKPFRAVYLGILPDPRRRALAERMRSHWMRFVNQGRPGEDWPAYDADTRETKIFALRDRVLSDPDRVRRVAWQGVDGYTF